MFKITIAALALTPALALAQQAPSYNINRAKLTWSWAAGPVPNDGVPDNFLVKCGTAPGVYSKTTSVPYPTKELAMRTAIGGNGNWWCVVTAQNAFGESGPSNELPFVAGAAASSPSGLGVTAQ